MRYQHLLLIGSDGVVQHHRILVLIWGREVVLEKKSKSGLTFSNNANICWLRTFGFILGQIPGAVWGTCVHLVPQRDSAGPCLRTPIHLWEMWCENLPWKGHGDHRERAPGWHTDKQLVLINKQTQHCTNAALSHIYTLFIHKACKDTNKFNLAIGCCHGHSDSFVVLPCRHAVWSCAQSSSSKDAQPKTEGYKRRVSLTCHRLQCNTEVQKLAWLM